MSGEVIREAVIKLRLETTKQKVEAPNLKSASQALEKYKKTVSMQMKGAAEEIDALKGEIEKLNKQNESMASTMEGVARQGGEAMNVMQGGLAQLGEGAVVAARGFAFLGIDAEQGIGKTVEMVGKLQGVLDVARGASQAFRNLSSMLRVTETAAGAAANAETLHMVAIKAKTKAMVIAKTVYSSLLKTLGPVGLAIAGITAALAAAAAAWAFFKTRSKDATKEAEKDLLTLNATSTAISENTRALRAQASEWRAFESQIKGVRSERESFLTTEERIHRFRRSQDLGKTGLGRFEDGFKVFDDVTDNKDALKAAEKARKDRDKFIKARRKELSKADLVSDAGFRDEDNEVRQGALKFENVEAKLRLQNISEVADQERGILSAIREQKNVAKSRLEDYKLMIQSEEKILMKKKEALVTARRMVQQERNRLLSLDEQIGRLTAAERVESRTLIERAKSGKITFDEVKRLEQLLGASQKVQKFAKDFFQKEGKLFFGGASILDGLGGAPARGKGSVLEQLEQNRDKAAGPLGKLGEKGALLEEGRIQAQLAILNERRKKASEKTSNQIGDLIDLEEEAIRRISVTNHQMIKMEKRLREIEKVQEQLNAANS